MAFVCRQEFVSYLCISPGAAIGAMLCLCSWGCVEPRCSLRAPVVPGCPLPLALTAICLSLLTSKQHKYSPSTRRYRELAGRAWRGKNRFEFRLNYMLSERSCERDKYHTGMQHDCRKGQLLHIFIMFFNPLLKWVVQDAT